MPDLKIVLTHADAREERAVTTGTKAWELFADDPSVIAARVDGDLRDLAYELQDGDEVEGVVIDSPDGHDILRHSTAHVMAQAVQQLFPDAKLGIGPPIENGFYYDFDVETPFVPEDLDKIETAMRKIIKEGQRFSRRVISDDDALDELAGRALQARADRTQGIRSRRGCGRGRRRRGRCRRADHLRQPATATATLAWKDLCRGPHLPTTKRIPAFKLMRTAAAYWRGDEKNKQLQRIYGTAWETKEALEPSTSTGSRRPRSATTASSAASSTSTRFPDELGSGLVVFHPKGGVIKRVMEDYVRQRHIEEGFSYVSTPHISKDGLFHTSGHLPYYADTMYPADGARRRELPASRR